MTTRLADELEQAALDYDDWAERTDKALPTLVAVLRARAARLRARAARVREEEGKIGTCINCTRADHVLLRRLTGPDLGPTRRGEPA